MRSKSIANRHCWNAQQTRDDVDPKAMFLAVCSDTYVCITSPEQGLGKL